MPCRGMHQSAAGRSACSPSSCPSRISEQCTCLWLSASKDMLYQSRPVSAGLWSLEDLDDPETARVLQQAQEQPDLFVLKPQREGGGNNLYGEEILEKLRQRKGLAAYILMQRIRPPIRRWDRVILGSERGDANYASHSDPTCVACLTG